MDGLSKSITSKSPEVENALKKVADASGKVIVEQEKLNALKEKSTTTDAKLIAQSERLRKAHADESAALRDVNNVLQEAENALGAVTGAADGAGRSFEAMGQQFAAIGRIGGPALMVGAVSALGQLTGVAAQATGALGLLPGVIGAAGLGLGTLKIATLGVSDALGALKYPEKFAEELAALSPNAQQATLAIRGLLPAFTELQQKSQDALFAGVGGELNALTNQYLPQIEATTTGIGSAFNSMFAGVTQQLLTPGTQASTQQFLANVTQSFQNLSGATAPLTSAFADIMNVGSSFLPQIAQGASDAAKAFGDFVHEAMQSGQMRQWMQEGLNVIQQLSPVVKNLATTFMQLGDQTKDSLPQMVNALNGMIDVLPAIVNAATALTAPLTSTLSLIGQIGEATKGMGSVSTSVWSSLTNTLFDVLQPLNAIYDIYKLITDPGGFAKDIGAGGTAQGDAQAKLDAARAAHGLPPIASGTGGIPGIPMGGYQVPRPANSGVGAGAVIPVTGPSWGPPKSPFAWDPSTGGSGSTPTPTFDPNQFKVSSVPVAPATAAPTGAGMGYGLNVDPEKVSDASDSVFKAQNTLEQDRLHVLELQSKGNASQRELLTAQNQVQEDERAYNKAQRELVDAQQGTWKKANDNVSGAMGDLQSVFAPLAQDFGISKGIPGIVENLTKMFGNMALGSAIGSSPFLQAGAMQLMAGNGTGAPGGYAVSALGPSAWQPGSGYPGDAALLANVPAGRYDGAKDLSKGLADCSSAVEDLVNLMDGKSTVGGSLTTHNASQLLPGMGFQPGMGGPGDFRIGYDPSHMQATLPDGTPFNWGSNAAAARGGVGGTGAYDPAFTEHWYRPVEAMGAPSPTGWAGPAVVPQLPAGQGGQGFGPGVRGPGIAGQGVGQPTGFNTGVAPGATPGGAGLGVGGMAMDGMMAATSALDVIAPGAGQAAKVGIQLANRAIQFGGQAAGIGASGLMETFLPAGSPLAGNSWFSKLAGGLSGARPASPNKAAQSQAAPPQPGGAGGGGGGDGQGGTNITNNFNMTQARDTEERQGRDLAMHLDNQYSSPGPGNPRG